MAAASNRLDKQRPMEAMSFADAMNENRPRSVVARGKRFSNLGGIEAPGQAAFLMTNFPSEKVSRVLRLSIMVSITTS